MSVKSIVRPLRSVLFVPGNRPRMLQKAKGLACDALILDLEDGVPLSEKERARGMVRAIVEEGGYTSHLILRINSFDTCLAEADLWQAFARGVDSVCLPMAETAGEVERLALLLGGLEQEHGLSVGAVGMMLMVETALGVLNSYAMARASRRVRWLCLGGEDLAHDLGAVRTKEGMELAHARATLVIAARAAGVEAIDSIYTDLTDPAGLAAEARHARVLGYSGKSLIHPAQIDPVNQAFTPSDEEVAYARLVMEAFEAGEARGEGVIALDGRMIDAPVVARAQRIVSLAADRPQS